MPHITVKGCTKDELVKITTDLLEVCVKEFKVEKSHFTIDFIQSSFTFSGYEGIESYPQIKISLFPRDKSAKDNVFSFISKQFENLGYKKVVVYFEELNKDNYYKLDK